MTIANTLLGSGIDALFGNSGNPNEYEINVSLDDIEIEAQVREEFEDEENSLIDLGKSLLLCQIQAIAIRPNHAGKDKPYLLIAGERRYRAARLVGMMELRARVMDLSDSEAADIQFAENIHRKNLTQIEEAKRIQRDLDKLGSVEAVLEKHNKSRAWLSKILSLLNLPDQAKRLITENVSADLEVINTVKTIEKRDPVAAGALVEELKEGRGKVNARDKAAQVKDQVKPKKVKEVVQPSKSMEEEGAASDQEETGVSGSMEEKTNDDSATDGASSGSELARANALGRIIASNISTAWDDGKLTLSFNRPLAAFLEANEETLQSLLAKLSEEAAFQLECEVPLNLFDAD
jgi:ParB family chromosome partitioning protein